MAPSQYQPNGGIVVDTPTINAGGTETFRGTGCGPNEVLTVLFDGKVIGTITANAQGAFAGSITIPRDTPQGTHTLTVRGSSCELNATITVSGTLAFTGASSHTGSTMLLGVAAIVLGLVLVVGVRRRRGRAVPAPRLAVTQGSDLDERISLLGSRVAVLRVLRRRARAHRGTGEPTHRERGRRADAAG